jgi:hypothetical protein
VSPDGQFIADSNMHSGKNLRGRPRANRKEPNQFVRHQVSGQQRVADFSFTSVSLYRTEGFIIVISIRCTMHHLLICTLTNKCTIISQIITLLHVSTLSCHPQTACNQYLAKLHQYVKCSCLIFQCFKDFIILRFQRL